MKIKNMLYAAMFAAIVAVLGLMPPIPLPFIPVPITLQTMGVMLAGSFLGKRLGFISMLLVVVIVLLGLPILSGGRGGLAVLTGPTGGFFIVWPFAAFLVGFLAEKFWKNINIGKYIVANIIGGIVLVYLVGAIYLSYITKMPIDKAFLATMAFIPGDVLKAIVVSVLCYKLKEISPINEIVR
ncbi:MAG: biotin transporter BioY [Fusobacterium periodonticum]|nr:biotin transporter BioY [Fusobacterium periodonticum]